MNNLKTNWIFRFTLIVWVGGISLPGMSPDLSSQNTGAHVKNSSHAANNTMYESIEAVAVHGNYAYAGVGKRLVVISIASSITPVGVAAIDVSDGSVMDVLVANNRAYVAAGGAGLQVMDISEPTNPKEIGFINTPGYAEDVAVAGQYAYVADGGAGVRVIDTSDPADPREVSFVYVLGYAFDVVVVGNYVYVAAAGAGLRVVDVSDPIHPVEVGGCDTPGYAYGLTVVGNTAYVADGWEGLRVIDVTNAKSPKAVGSYDTPGWAFDVAVVGNLAYVADAFAGVRVIDVSNQAHPIEIGAYEPRGDIHDVAVVGSLVYAVDRRNGLRVVQMSTPGHPTQLGFCRLGNDPEANLSGNIFSEPSIKQRIQNLTSRPDLSQADQVRPHSPLAQKRDAREKVDMRLEPVGQIGGPTQAVAVNGDYAYVGIGLRVEVLDISDSTNPQQVGSTRMLDGFVTDITTAGSYAYATVGGKGLWVIDISDPTHPNEVGFLRTPGYAEGVTVAGNYAYVAAGGAGLRVMDISDKAHPREISFVYTLGYAFDVEVVGNVAYVAGAGAGLRIVDVSNPALPKEVGGYDTPGYAHGVAVSGSLAYVADSWEGLRVIDISDPTQPAEVGSYDTPGQAFDVAISGAIAYVADAFMGLRIVDISDLAHLSEIGVYVPRGNAYSVAVVSSIVYVADRNRGLHIVNVFALDHPTQLGFYSPMGYAHDLAIGDHYAYVAAGFYGLRIVDISDPSCPVEVGTYDTKSYAIAVAVRGNYAYVGTSPGVLSEAGLHVVDISDPANPTQVGFYLMLTGQAETGGALLDIAIVGEIAYIPNEPGLLIVSVSNPAHPTWLSFSGTLETPEKGPTDCVAIADTLAYVGQRHWGGGITIIDISNPIVPSILGSYSSPGGVHGVAVSKNKAYVAGGAGMRVVDVSDPTHPTGLGFYDTPATATSVTVSGTIAYVTDGKGGLHAVDVSNPSAPALIAAYNTPGYAQEVRVVEEYVYVADGEGGLLILKKTTSKTNIDLQRSILTVTSTADSGPGTLRWCLENAVSGDTITFDLTVFLSTNPMTIRLSSPLPPIGQGNLIIDASNAGVILNFFGLPDTANGLLITSNGNVIKGLQILYAPCNGIAIRDGAQNNIIGGDRMCGTGPMGEGNVISRNGHSGVYIEGTGTMGNIVIGNRIGTDASGFSAEGNNRGVVLASGAQDNRIGGIDPDERNLISGNGQDGIKIYDMGTDRNIIIGNYIGVDASGTASLVNGGFGIHISQGPSHNRVGGTDPKEKNVISTSRMTAVFIEGAETIGNIIAGNYIGTDASGTAALGVGSVGVWLDFGTSNNMVERNVISGCEFGVGFCNGSSFNSVIGNLIGTDGTGTVVLGNRQSGVFSADKAGEFNRIEGNVIAGNTFDGVSLSEGAYNLVIGNRIGVSAYGTHGLGNGWNGVSIENNAGHTFIEQNIISGNRKGGIRVASFSDYNFIAGNYIGTNATGMESISNSFGGIEIDNARNNYIGPGNMIANNVRCGIEVKGNFAIGNTISRNSITNNSSKGISLSNRGNAELAPPVISSVTTTSVSGTGPPNCTIEIFSDPADEGKVYEGTTTSNSIGVFTFTIANRLTGPHVTATATDVAGNTSEFSVSVPTGVEEEFRQSIPTTYALYQNYPNPFNPSTIIKYNLPRSVHAVLKIFDLLGREVATLVDKRKEAGYYQVQWNPQLASGVYFYRLQAGDFEVTRKLILLR